MFDLTSSQKRASIWQASCKLLYNECIMCHAFRGGIVFTYVIRAASPAFAGHAGEMDNPGAPVVLPFEMWLGVMGVAVLLLIAIVWLVNNAVRLRKIDQRLRVLEKSAKE